MAFPESCNILGMSGDNFECILRDPGPERITNGIIKDLYAWGKSNTKKKYWSSLKQCVISINHLDPSAAAKKVYVKI